MSEMTVTEKVAYLKGLMEGLDFQADTKEAKIIKMMADILSDLADEVVGLQDDVDDINEYLDDIYDKKYSKIPKKLQKYDHLMHLRGIENCEELLAKAAQEIKRINDAYDI